jgi:energy-coupling factor transporter ATP-binding protein EcfA2
MAPPRLRTQATSGSVGRSIARQPSSAAGESVFDRFSSRGGNHGQALKTVNRSIPVEMVFTPTTQARLNFVEREAVKASLSSALQTPGTQVVVYGESGSGKSTLLLNSSSEFYPRYITTRCNARSTYDTILLDAFDKLGQFYTSEKSSETKRGQTTGAEAEFFKLKASVDASTERSQSESQSRIVPPQLTAQRLSEFLGLKNLCWVLEDFHKTPESERQILSQILKMFSDAADDYPSVRIIAVGATDTARQVIEYDREMKDRVAEILVPPMSLKELGAIVTKGAGLLNIDMRGVMRYIVELSVGVASACHHLCLNSCRAIDLKETAAIHQRIGREDVQKALEMYMAGAEDTIKSSFDCALRGSNSKTLYDYPRLLLNTLSKGETGGMRLAEIARVVRKSAPNVRQDVLLKYLEEMTRDERGGLLRHAPDGRYRFSEPRLHLYAKANFGQEPSLAGETLDQLNTILQSVLRFRGNRIWMK